MTKFHTTIFFVWVRQFATYLKQKCFILSNTIKGKYVFNATNNISCLKKI
jgi:hypothetical protein